MCNTLGSPLHSLPFSLCAALSWAELSWAGPLLGDSRSWYFYLWSLCFLSGSGLRVVSDSFLLGEVCTICLISTLLHLINIQLFAYVCIFQIQVLVMCWFSELSYLNKEVFSLWNTSTSYSTVQHVCMGWNKHVWPSAWEIIDVGREGKQELETKSINNIRILICLAFAAKTFESAFNKLEVFWCKASL